MEAADVVRIVAYLVLCAAFVLCCVMAAIPADEVLERGDEPVNEHARLLGRTVMAKVYEGSPWERMVVVAVSWKGAIAVRPEWDPEARARWIRKDVAPQRVREIDE